MGLAAVARAAPVDAHYVAYAAGLPVLDLDADFNVTATAYHVQLKYRTAGAAALLYRGGQDTVVDGHFVAGRPVPTRFFSTGYLRGKPRVTQIDYRGGQPHIRQLMPPSDEEREPVPEAQQANTIDTLSAMAELVRTVNETGRCEGHATTFDGRRLSELEARTAGREMLAETGRSSFSGPALRCDFVGRQTAGFMHDADEASRRPQRGSAWFAALTPGGELVPVRMVFTTRWFGEATMYVASRDP